MLVLKDILGDEEILIHGNVPRRGPKPKFTDMEVIALSLTTECMGIDSERFLFGKITSTYSSAFTHIIGRRQFNVRRKNLLYLQESIRAKMAALLNEITEVFAIDSMPLEVCKMARMERSKLGKDSDYGAPDKGYCASQDRWYYGYKLHGACSPSGVLQSFDLSKASVHDIHYLKDVSHVFKNCIITGDRGYISKNLKEELWAKSNVCLEAPGRSNQKDKKPVLYALKKIRKRIESVFSQLCVHFMIQRNFAKSFIGYRTRILAKISGMTVLQYINKFVNNRPIGHIKYALW